MSRSILSHAVWGIALGTCISLAAIAQPARAATSVKQATAGTISAIKIEGNQRIEESAILTYLALAPGQSFAQEEVNAGLKRLFTTGFFSDIKMLRQDNVLIVQVEENPLISRVAFEGNGRIETADLENEIELQARSLYSRDKVQSDVKRILDIYRRSGRYNAIVEPKIIKQSQNRVDLVYEITEGPVARVAHITFIGNAYFDNSDLLQAIRTEEENWYKLFTDNDKFDPDRLLFDQELLRRLYQNAGFIDFTIKSANAELSPDKESFYITFVIDEGSQYSFGDVSVINRLKTKTPPDFSSLITTESGETYNASEVENSIDAITTDLGNRGYAFVDVQPKVKRDEDKRIAHLTYLIKPGPRVYVERINITGNSRTLDEVVRREFRLSEGDPYNTSKLQRTEQRINNLGFFESVEMSKEEGSAKDKTIVNVNVQEQSTGEVNIGAGYSTSDGVLGQLGISERNLLGRGQDLRTQFTLASRRRQARLAFTEPYFLNREVSAGFDIYRLYEDFQDESQYVSDSQGITLRMRYALKEKLHHNTYYAIRKSTIKDVANTASTFIQGQLGENTASIIGHNIVYDDRDNRFHPTKGYFIDLNQEIAGLGGDSRYIRHEMRTSYYYPLYPKWILGGQFAGGYTFGYDDKDIRINERFFLGGDDFRGFQNAGLGPRDSLTTDALGGNAYYVATAELRFPLGLPEELGLSGAVFSDVGSLWQNDDSGANIQESDSVRASAGVGVLWSSPFGPIRIDLAYPFLKERFDRTENLRFSLGTRF